MFEKGVESFEMIEKIENKENSVKSILKFHMIMTAIKNNKEDEKVILDLMMILDVQKIWRTIKNMIKKF